MISVVLVEPRYSGNIGSVARVMKNFGFKDLVLVNPCEIDEDSYIMAVHAQEVIKKAKKVESLQKLKEEFDVVIGTTAIATGKDDYFLRMTLPVHNLKEKLAGVDGKIAIVFGREDDGLHNEEIELCDFCVTIPTKEEYKSMNLSHSTAIVLYELSDIPRGKVRLASEKEKQLLLENTSVIVEKIGHPAEKRKVFNTMIERIIGRAVITGREANTLIGVLKTVKNKIKR
jgi:tRNA/rRNA methyltransferase